MKHSTKLTVDNSLQISQSLLNSLKLLQMDSLALEAHIREQFQENPVLEYVAPIEDAPERWEGQFGGEADAEMGWERSASDHGAVFDSLEFFLYDQIDRLRLDDEQTRLCKALVQMLDDSGYLRAEHLDLHMESKEVQAALSIVQSLDPPGIGARSLRECLMLQLEREGLKNSVAFYLTDCWLEEVGRRNYQKLSRLCGRSIKEIEAAVREILRLNPKPGRGYTQNDHIPYIRPDFYIAVQGEQLTVRRNSRSFPQICVSDFYEKLYADTSDEEVRQYLKERIAAAKKLIAGLEQRSSTTERCLQVILEAQKDFFLNSSRQLRPLTLEMVADAVGVHISTVSRAINGRYLDFAARSYPLKYFFVRAAGGSFQQRVSTAQIKALIRGVIQNEDPCHPISDQGITDILRQGGSDISRRAVAKYREEMKIPSSRQRRKK